MGLRGLVVLGLRGGRSDAEAAPAPPSEASVLRGIVEEAFDVLAEALEAAETTPPDVTAALGSCRNALAAGVAAPALVPLATTCFGTIRRYSSHARGSATAQRAQVTALVAMVRETVATIAGNQTTLHDTLTGSAERVTQIAKLDNLQEIQARLIEEVAALKQIAIERRASWEQTFQEFGNRLTGLETQLHKTRREATTDPLTGVANRRVFERACGTWMEPNHPPFVLAMIDVDDFKGINDELGHLVGDQVLVAVAQTLTRTLRPDDLIARLGGDEFAVLAAPLTLQQAHTRFTDVVGAIGTAARPFVGSAPTPTVSIGLAEFCAGDTQESLQQRADQALYEAKRLGKGRVAVKAAPFIRDLVKARRPASGR